MEAAENRHVPNVQHRKTETGTFTLSTKSVSNAAR